MKKLIALVAPLLFLSANGWATYIPVNGSTIVVQAANNNTTALPVSVFNSTMAVIFPSPQAVTQSGIFSMANSSTAVTFVSPQTVIQSTGGVSGSTVAVTNAVGTTLAVSGTVTSNQGTNPWIVGNSSMAVSQVTGNWSIGNSSIAVSQVNANWTIGNSSIAVTQVNPNWTIGNSSIAVSQVNPNWTVGNSTIATVGTLSDNGATTATNRIGTLPATYQKAFLGGTAATKGNNAALSVSVVGNLFVSVMPDISTASYSASTNTYTLATTTMDVTAICGNATNMVMVTGLRLTCTQTTAGIVPLTVAKRSSAYGGVTISTMTAVADDSNYVAYKSSAVFFSGAGPQNGTLVGYVDQAQLGCMAAATAAPNDIYISPPEWRQKPIVLRGASECLGVNFQGATMTGAKISPTWKWWEVNTITP